MSKGSKKKEITGILEMTFEGYGFVISDQSGGEDVFVPAHAVGDALHRDHVEVRVRMGRRGKPEGAITRVLERGLKQLVGRFEIRGKSAIVITNDFRVKRRVLIPKNKELNVRHNEMVVVLITQYPRGDNPIVGEVVKSLGARGMDQTELNILMAKHNLPEGFPKSVYRESKDLVEKFYERDDTNRVDLTELPFTTIDGEDAKDFDDAIYGERLDNGTYRVWIAIADVSHFVKFGSKIDKEASKRATSVYLPGTCIPMLPEDLSTDICSLVPGEMRYCFTAELIIDQNGLIKDSKFYKSKIKSKYRMTYTEANDYLTHGKEIEAEQNVLTSLEHLNEASLLFRKHRIKRGSMDFDLPEPEILLDMTGRPENIVKADRNATHMLIEDLMIAANEAVAVLLTSKGYPCVYRIHDKPDTDKLGELKVLLKYLGHKVTIGPDPTPKKLANVVKIVHGRPEERLINMLLLRAMSQAVYSTKNIGHFGLASTCYCHFTSPIRRYPDLLIHRLLADAIGAEKFKMAHSIKYFKEEAKESSKKERKSMEAERESLNLYSAMFMRDKIGEAFDGLISHTAKKGIFVELIDYFVEGMIKPEDLPGDKYRFDPKKFAYIGRETGRSLHIGDKIRVVVKDVNIEERRVYFEPEE
jgi:ribonuclease R